LAFLLDTDVVIHLRDGEQGVWARVRELDPPLVISAIGRIELENGVYRDPEWQSVRRVALDTILEIVETLDLTAAEIATYRATLEATGFSKRKVADRVTAATALVHGLSLVTMNGRDFRDIAGLKLIEWEAPAPPPS
jgi:tRNA(fMet)-specific endonuclease VapC